MNKTNNAKKNKFSLKKWIDKNAPAIVISFAAFVLLVGVLLAAFQAKEELVQYSIKNESVYLMLQDEKVDFESQITLDHENKVTKLYVGDEFEMDLTTEPIYYEKKAEVVFPSSMSVIFPIEGKVQKKLNRYTVANAEGIQTIISNQGLKYALTNGFIYDGADLYFFAEPGTVRWGTNQVEISPLSFVSCFYHGDLVIYNYETKEAKLYENVQEDVIMEFDSYTINLSYDSVAVSDGSFLLQKNIENLPVLTN